MATLLDRRLPDCHFAAAYSAQIEAPRSVVYRCLRKMDLSGSLWVRVLFGLRSLPGLFSSKRASARRLGLTFKDLLAGGFLLLDEAPDQEMVLGVAGAFWKPAGAVRRITVEDFDDFNEPGCAKAAVNFLLEESGRGTRLSTETRILCLDEESRKKFSLYWFFIRPFSGVVRREMLRTVREAAEGEGFRN